MTDFSYDRAIGVLRGALYDYYDKSEQLKQLDQAHRGAFEAHYGMYCKHFAIHSPERASKLYRELWDYKARTDWQEQLRATINGDKELVSFCLAVRAWEQRKIINRAKDVPNLNIRDTLLQSGHGTLKIIEEITEHFGLTLPNI